MLVLFETVAILLLIAIALAGFAAAVAWACAIWVDRRG
jgi:hypothetical protein